MRTSIKVLLVAFLITASSFVKEKNCKLLRDGNYILKFTSGAIEGESKIQVKQSAFKQYWSDGKSRKGKIRWISTCSFILDDRPKQDASGLGKLLLNSLGEPCIQLIGIHDDTITFKTTHPGNVHITISEGQFIRVK
jgi:hypothetical protein